MIEMISTFGIGQPYDLFPSELGSPSRSSFTYLTYAGALAAPTGGSGVFDVYRAQRSEDGWATEERLSRSSSDALPWTLPGGISSDHEYTFSSDHRIDYLRGPDGSYELTGLGSVNNEPYARGRYISPGGTHVIFVTGKVEGARRVETQSQWCMEVNKCDVLPLEPNAPPEGTGAVYDRSADGPTHVVSLLPGNLPPGAGQQAFYIGTSKDATSVAFEVAGTLYVRADNGLEGERTEEVAGGAPVFAGISDDGRYLFYIPGGSKGTIHRFDTTTEADVEVNPVGEGEIVNVSGDGSHVYFVSEQQLDGSEGTVGQPNMYVWSGGSPEYVATVLASDLVRTSGAVAGVPALTTWTRLVANPEASTEDQGPGADSSRATPDGSVLAFESRAQLTPYDNAGHTEIYRYDDDAKELACVSCNLGGGAATSDARLQELRLVAPPFIVHNLSEDGNRIFFETSEALVEGDTNGANDIYEWRAEGGGSVALISSGKSPAYSLPEGWGPPFIGLTALLDPVPNLLLSVTPDGSDVYFSAKEALAPGAGENGTQAVYDARVDGGFPQQAAAVACVEEGCKLATSSGAEPALPGPRSEGTSGAGNVKPKKKTSCPGVKHRRVASGKRGRCPKRHKKGKNEGVRQASISATAVPTAGEPGARSNASTPPAGRQAAPALPGPVPAAAPTNCSAADFGIKKLEGSLSSTVAGAHPDFTTNIEFTGFESSGLEDACAAAEEVTVSLPPGLLGNPAAVPACSMGDFATFGACPPDSQVGVTKVKLGEPLHTGAIEPIYNLAPPHPDREVARFGFIADLYPVFIDVHVRTASDYGVTAIIYDPPGLGVVIRAKTTLWGDPSGKAHDKERFTTYEVLNCPLGHACLAENEERASTIPIAEHKAFMGNPSACEEMPLGVEAKSYQPLGQPSSATTALSPTTDCTNLPFAPSFEAEPTSHVAGAPTGLKTALKLPQHLGPEERSTATMREARVTLPEGMQVAAGAANWIGTCSEEEVGYHEEVDAACPDSSKLGTATILSPALSVPIEGTLYQRTPRPGHQLGLWLVSDALGLHIKLPGELEPDPTTGRLSAVFRDLPQVPVEEIDLDVWGGPRAPLQNPDHCGSFATDYSFTPHSNDPAVTGQSQMKITEGCNQGFSPTLHAGVTDPTAGAYSPFVLDLNREDGQQALRGFEVHLPEGELAKIKGVPLCPDAAAAAGTCPADSRIGTVQATTGPGPDPLQVPQPGKAQPAVYFAGPYQGAPYSIVTEVPAQAGPFDLGVLAVRSALEIDPETAQATVKADPLPQFFEGVGIAYRRLHAVIDRPEFSLNPTDCRETAVTSDVTSTQGAVAHPQARFQVDGCKALKYSPKLKLSFRGQTQRTGDPAVKAVLTQKSHQANTAAATVLLPQGEFIDNAHIGNPCTMPQFQADKCPKKSVLGTVKASSPLLDKSLTGKIYFRSNGGARELPDIVADLRGPIHIVLVGYIDAVKTGPESSRVRTRFLHVPDAPVTKATFSFFGGKRGLIENSHDLCKGTHRAGIELRAQNGRAVHTRPALDTSCSKTKHGRHHKERR
jgi:hypothetical protein